MEQARGRLGAALGIVLLLVLSVATGCGSSDSSADEPLRLDTVADAGQLQLVTLQISGMS